jgi:hypothetical protein
MSHLHRIVNLFLLLTIFSFRTLFGYEGTNFEGWTHLELGAGNYGQDGHTKVSQAMTVLKKIKDVSNAKNYIDDLEDSGYGDYKPEHQYGVLFWTLDQLVSRYGDIGVFHLNDLYERLCKFCCSKVKRICNRKRIRLYRNRSYPWRLSIYRLRKKSSQIRKKEILQHSFKKS